MLVYDAETDGLLDSVSRIHVLKIIDRTTGRRLSFNGGVYADGSPAPRDGTIEDGLRLLEDAEVIGGHNVIDYDNRVFRRLYPWWNPKGRIRDSLVEARVIWTNIWDIDQRAIKRGKRPAWFLKQGLAGTHKLAAWGGRLGEYKGDFNGPWDAFTPTMDDYGGQDVEVNLALFEKIEAKGYSQEALDLENDVAQIIAMQEDHGFLFDQKAAEKLLIELQVRHAELADQLRTVFKPWWEPKRKGGRPEVIIPQRDNRKQGYMAGVPATKVQLVVFNPASRDHIASRLTALYGWKPVEFTETGKPKIDETTLDGIDAPEAALLVEYLTVEKRLGQLATGKQAWMTKVGPDGRIHGRVNTNGAVTGRMTHSGPNMAQVPSVSLDDDDNVLFGYAGGWGYEARSLFIVPPGHKLVGTDAEGLELRMLAHYMARYDGGAYVNTVVNGSKKDGTDVHSVNTRAAGLRLRANGKTFIYAYLYGAGNFKLGLTVVEDMTPEARAAFFTRYPPGDERDKAIARLGGRARKRIEEGLPALGKLQEMVKEKAKRGYLRSLDGRLLHVRSQHSALNTLLQGGGAVVMKRALVIAHRTFTKVLNWTHGVEWSWVANVHDEYQKEVQELHAETAGRIGAQAIKEAGESFGLLCPLAGAYQIGRTWADSH